MDKNIWFTKIDNMAKAILEFNLDEHEDVVAHLRCVKATKMAIVLWDMDQYLRAKTKHAPDDMPPIVYEALLETREELRVMMQEAGIDLDELLN